MQVTLQKNYPNYLVQSIFWWCERWWVNHVWNTTRNLEDWTFHSRFFILWYVMYLECSGDGLVTVKKNQKCQFLRSSYFPTSLLDKLQSPTESRMQQNCWRSRIFLESNWFGARWGVPVSAQSFPVNGGGLNIDFFWNRHPHSSGLSPTPNIP